MIPLYRDDEAKRWLRELISQSQKNHFSSDVERSVAQILADVRTGGDQALCDIAKRFGDPAPRSLSIDSTEITAATERLSSNAKKTIDFAADRIRLYAEAVMAAVRPVTVEYSEYSAGLDLVPVQRAACYVPGGRYPLPSTALMTAMTATVAGVKEVALFTPVLKDEILYAGKIAGVIEFHEIGGAQAIAAAAFGTGSIRAVDMIVGPGNAYVTEAKRQVQGLVGIDMLAGPSEIAVIADEGGNASWVTLDLLSQAEHDPDARSYLLTDSVSLAEAVEAEIPRAVRSLNLPEFVQEALAQSAILVLPDLAACADAANAIAPEHLLLHVKNGGKLRSELKNFGALFIGYHATVPYGDYAAGPNHTLPTNRAARFSGALNPLTFLRAQSWLSVPNPAPDLAECTSSFAEIEGLTAHAAASRARIGALKV